MAGGGAAARLRARPQPVEGVWSSLKGVELANLTSEHLGELVATARAGIDRIRRTPNLAYGFLHGCADAMATHLFCALVLLDLQLRERHVDLVCADFVHCDLEAEFEGFGVAGCWEDQA